MFPFFSVVMPSYNRDGIEDSLNSILNQTYKDFELIIVDDHSEIRLDARVDLTRDSRIKYYYLEKNGGAAVARNFGVSKALGDYIAFIDDDDEWMSEKLMVIYNKIKENRPDFIYHNVILNLINEKLTYIPKKKQENSYYPKMLYINCIGGTPMVLIKRDFFNRIGGFNSDLRSDEDGELFIRVAKNTNSILYIDQVLGVFNTLTRTSSLTKSLNKRIESRNRIKKIYEDEIHKLLTHSQICQMLEFMYSDFSYAALLNYDKKNAFKYYIKSFGIRGNLKFLILASISLISIKFIFYLRTKI